MKLPVPNSYLKKPSFGFWKASVWHDPQYFLTHLPFFLKVSPSELPRNPSNFYTSTVRLPKLRGQLLGLDFSGCQHQCQWAPAPHRVHAACRPCARRRALAAGAPNPGARVGRGARASREPRLHVPKTIYSHWHAASQAKGPISPNEPPGNTP